MVCFHDFLKILTKNTREHLSLNASWFSYARTHIITIIIITIIIRTMIIIIIVFGKFDLEKNTKKLHSK